MQAVVMTGDQVEAFLRNVIGLVIRKYGVASPADVDAEFFYVEVDDVGEDETSFVSVDLILTGAGRSAPLFVDAISAQCKLDGITFTDGWADADEGRVELTVQARSK